MPDPHTVEADLLLAIQKGLPLEADPLGRLGAPLGLSARQVLERVQELIRTGVGRRFGAVFDSASLGYQSTLCAADVPEDRLDHAAAALAPHPGVTHCYQRDGHPNLWFTLTAMADAHGREIARISAALAPSEVLSFPALRVFKIEAVFDSRGGSGHAARQAASPERGSIRRTAAPPLPEREREVVRRMQGMMPVTEDPFRTLAEELQWDPSDFVSLLARWKQAGILRRVGLIVRHRQVGFSANSMCVWPVPPGRLEEAGRTMARSRRVSHCYERPAAPCFPYNLYAMVHAQSREELEHAFGELSREAGLDGGKMMWSVREFKKSSPVFFSESEQA